MATVNQLSHGAFQASIMLNGKRIRKNFKSKEEAEIWVTQLKLANYKGEALPSSNGSPIITWSQLRDAVYQRVWAGTKSEQTSMTNSLCVINFFGPDNSFANIKTEDIDRFISSQQEKKNESSTINRKLAALSKMLHFACDRNWIARVPKIEKFKEDEHRLRWLTEEEETKLVASLREIGKHEAADLVVFLIDTGARVGEALKLKWKDVDMERGKVTFWDTKNSKPRTIPVTKAVLNLLVRKQSAYPQGLSFRDFYVFPISQSSFNHIWLVVKASMGLLNDDQFVPHALRHTCASRMVQRGVPLLSIKEFLGHKSLYVTIRYAHLASKQLEEAIKVLEKDNTHEQNNLS